MLEQFDLQSSLKCCLVLNRPLKCAFPTFMGLGAQMEMFMIPLKSFLDSVE